MPARPPLSIAVYRAPATTAAEAATAGGPGRDALVARLEGLRQRFSSLGRTEATIFDFHRRGKAREILLGLFLSGTGSQGELRQEGGKLRIVLAPVADGGWQDGVGPDRELAVRVGGRAALRERGRDGPA